MVSDHEAKICTAGTLARWGAQGSATQGCTKLAGGVLSLHTLPSSPHLNLEAEEPGSRVLPASRVLNALMPACPSRLFHESKREICNFPPGDAV